MKVGIFTRTFDRPTLEETLDAVKEHSIDSVQFDMGSAGVPNLPDHIEEALCDRIKEEMAARALEMATLSGTFNMIHPDVQERDNGMRSLGVLAASCHHLGTSVITLCTGTLSLDSMF